MNAKRLILSPGDALARRFDRGYAKFMARMRRKIKKGNQRLAIYSLFARAECGLAFAVIPLMLCIYPLIALGDPYTWRKVYGELAKDMW